MKKQVALRNGKKLYLLGKDQNDDKIWLEAPSWDCGWYWGLGYVESYQQNWSPEKARDIMSHDHFDSLFLNNPEQNGHEAFKKFFKDTTLNDDEIWQIIDYMTTCYTLRKTAEILGRGYSHYTEKAKLQELVDKAEVKKINEEMLPTLFFKIDKILTP